MSGLTFGVRVAGVAIALGLAAHGAAAQDARPGQPSIATEAKHPLRPMFDQFVQTIESRFVKPERLSALGWKGRAEAAWAEIAAVKSAAEAAPILNRLLAPLETSHTQVFTPDEPEFYIIADVFGVQGASTEVWAGPPMLAGIGVFTAKFDGRDHVTHVLEGSPADKAGIKVGDEIVSVDGGPYSPVAAFRGKAGKTSVLEVRKTRDGERKRIDVSVVTMQPTAAFDKAARNSARIVERGGKRIGYVHLWQMRSEDLLGSILASIDPTRAIRERRGRTSFSAGNAGESSAVGTKALDALIVDNRTKIGGQSNIGAAYLDALAGSRGGAIRSATRRDESDLTPVPKSFAGRSVMLIDQGTRSAAELFAFGFAHEKMGPLIGTKTAGAVTGSFARLLPGGLLLFVGIADVRIDGQTLEGKGVAPTMTVERPIPYSDGADPQLEAAVRFLVGE